MLLVALKTLNKNTQKHIEIVHSPCNRKQKPQVFCGFQPFLKNLYNSLLIRMSLVRVQLPEPRFPQISADFLLSVFYPVFMQNWIKMVVEQKHIFDTQ